MARSINSTVLNINRTLLNDITDANPRRNEFMFSEH